MRMCPGTPGIVALVFRDSIIGRMHPSVLLVGLREFRKEAWKSDGASPLEPKSFDLSLIHI